MGPYDTMEDELKRRDEEIRDLSNFARTELQKGCDSFVGRPLTEDTLGQMRAFLESVMWGLRARSRWSVFDDMKIDVVQVGPGTLRFQLTPLTVEARDWLQEQINRGLWTP